MVKFKNEKRITLTNMVLSYLNEKGEYTFNTNSFTPSLAHRIDRNTSGLVVFGKNIKALHYKPQNALLFCLF